MIRVLIDIGSPNDKKLLEKSHYAGIDTNQYVLNLIKKDLADSHQNPRSLKVYYHDEESE